MASTVKANTTSSSSPSGSTSTTTSKIGWKTYTRLTSLRHAANFAFNIYHLTPPIVYRPSKTEWIASAFDGNGNANGTKAKEKEKPIRLDFYYPPSPSTSISTSTVEGEGKGKGKPALLTFHGGGFILGDGTHDSKFSHLFNTHPSIKGVSIGISYRLAPEHPFPTPVEDCVSAIIHIYTYADRYGIDRDQIFLGGWSAGGNLVFSAVNLLNSLSLGDTSTSDDFKFALPSLSSENGNGKVEIPRIKGIIAFYPLLDYSISREDKRSRMNDPTLSLPDSLTTLFDSSYLPPSKSSVNLLDPRLSPSRASDILIDQLPPIHLVVCQHDMLYEEGIVFEKRLKGLGKSVTLREVANEKHAWDKPVPPWQKKSVKEEYEAAIETVVKILQGSE